MTLTEQDIARIRQELDECKNPMFFFDDDPDGLCSFLLLYRYKGEGKGVVVKSKPMLREVLLKRVQEYSPDKIFILDVPIVEQDFLDAVNVPVIWLDHHEPLKRHKVHYFNPMVSDPINNYPTSYWCYKVVDQDIWIAMVGCVADWFVPEFAAEFSKENPGLFPPSIKEPGKAIFKTNIGRIGRILSFVLKGKHNDVMKCILTMTRIENPHEILSQKTPRGKFIYKRYKMIKEGYDELIGEALKQDKREKMLIYTYSENRMSFTSELSNELLYRFPNKAIVVCREKSGEMKCSLRSGDKLKIHKVLKSSLKGVDGYGGGHDYACGCSIKIHDFEKFLNQMREELKR